MVGIIGGSGFVGSRLAMLFIENNVEFKIIDKNMSKFFENKCTICDIRDLDNLTKSLNGSDIVINLAAEHRDDVSPKSLYDDVNVEGSRNVCKACDELDIKKIIFTSSVAVYGFAPIGTDETGEINYFNDYGRTKWEAEIVYREWLGSDSIKSLTIIRPTVIFGERNRGNVYNLLKQISSGLFPMIGNGKNVKSMAYVENIASFLEYSLNNSTGENLFNYIDKPDFDMNHLVKIVKSSLGKKENVGFHWPYFLGYFGGLCFDVLAFIIRKKLPISSIRIKKFSSNSSLEASNIKSTSFVPPVSIEEGLRKTIKYEFIDTDNDDVLFYTE